MNAMGHRTFAIKVLISLEDTVGKVSDRFMQIVSNFQQKTQGKQISIQHEINNS